MKVAVIQFPGSNCERETMLALKRAGLEAISVLWNDSYDRLSEFAAYVIVGGFSYEDRVRSGLIAAMDPLMQALSREAEAGKAILGICNGAQILVESGLVPGLAHNEVAIALASNRRILDGKLMGTGFYNDWVYMRASHVNEKNAFSSETLVQQPMHIPVAHGEGRFVLSDELYAALKKTDAVFYYYCDQEGNVFDKFPINPNGARFNLAGVSNARGNVLALMPHPERCLSGDALFGALKDYIARWKNAGSKSISSSFLDIAIPGVMYNKYILDDSSLHFWVGLNINDNEAISLENSLCAQGLALHLKRYVHWQIDFKMQVNLEEVKDKIIQSDFIFNRQKEYTLDFTEIKSKGKKIYMVEPLDDDFALHKQNLLINELNIPEIKKVTRQIVWAINAENQDLSGICKTLETRPIFGNPLSYQGFYL